MSTTNTTILLPRMGLTIEIPTAELEGLTAAQMTECTDAADQAGLDYLALIRERRAQSADIPDSNE